MPGAMMQYTQKLSKKDITNGKAAHSIVFVMDSSEGKHNGKTDYYISTDGRRYTASRCKLLQKNSGFVFV